MDELEPKLTSVLPSDNMLCEAVSVMIVAFLQQYPGEDTPFTREIAFYYMRYLGHMLQDILGRREDHHA